MGIKGLGDWLSSEIGLLSHVSFWVVAGVVALVIWRAMEWRYRGIIEGFEQRMALFAEKSEYLEQRHRQPPLEKPARIAEVEDLSPSNAPPLVQVEEERIYVPEGVDVPFLIELYRENTDIQAEKLAATYVGKWMRIETEIQNVSKHDSQITVATRPLGCGPLSSEALTGIWLRFNQDFERIEMFRKGDTISAEGRITSIGPFDVTLEPAELI